MWIRKRTRKLKDGNESITFQAIETFRDKGKVKQKIVSLGSFSNPKEALEEELLFLKRTRKDLDVPLSEYKEVKVAFGLYPLSVPVPLKKAEKMRKKIEGRYKKQMTRMSKLESVATKFRIKDATDTTN